MSTGVKYRFRFINITPIEFQKALSSGDRRDPITIFRNVLSKTWSDHRVAVNFYNEQQPLVLMVQYDGTDVVDVPCGTKRPEIVLLPKTTITVPIHVPFGSD